MTNRHTIYILITSLIFVMIVTLTPLSCGLPNPFDTSENTNPPFLVETMSSNNVVFMTIYSFNTEINAPNFNGYNVYFYYDEYGVSNELYIKNNLLLIEYLTNGPTVLATPTDGIQSSSIVLGNNNNNWMGRWLNLSNGLVVDSQTNQIQLGYTFHFIVTSKNKEESDSVGNYYLVYKETIEKNDFFQTNNLSNILTFNNRSDFANFVFSSNTITPSDNTYIQDLGYYSNWFDVMEAPLEGYSVTSMPLVSGHIYAYYETNESTVNYGKLMAVSITNGQLIYHYSYQLDDNNREI